jgi:Ca2+-binding RTX toxin-like protein
MTYQEFLDALGFQESSNIYNKENSLGYIGKYQFGESALIDIGYYVADGTSKNDWIGNWTLASGVSSKTVFLNNNNAQEAAIIDYMVKQWSYLNSVKQYEGQILNGVKITISGMLAGAHLVGNGGEKQYLNSGGDFVPVDGNKTPITKYMQQFSGYDTPFSVDHSIDETIKGGSGSDTLYGLGGADELIGQAGDDTLVGGAGDDTLNGGTGNNTLIGGEDFDTYIYTQGDGVDTLIDSDGSGQIVWDLVNIQGDAGALSDQWKKFNTHVWQDQKNPQDLISYDLQTESDGSQTLYIIKNGDVLKVADWHQGDLGISLGAGAQPPAPLHTYNGDQRAPINDNNAYDWSATSWTADGTLTGGIVEQNFNDVITGSDQADKINGLGGNDALDGGAGNDQIDGGEGNDLIAGGVGSDIIHGGAGNDEILSATGLNVPQRAAPDDAWQVSAGKAVWTQGSTWGIANNPNNTYIIYGGGSLALDNSPDVIYGDAGDDHITGGHGDDYIDGGTDNDVLWGNGGNDIIDGGTGDDNIYGDGVIGSGFYQTTSTSIQGNDFLDGGEGRDWIVGGGKNDVLLGGMGNDFLWGDDKSETLLPGQYHGKDYLDGGVGDDLLIGGGNDDTLIGGIGNDTLLGDDNENNLALQYHGNDYLDGGTGDDKLYGGGGNDTLHGGSENDTLYGDGGNDTLIGGTGNDIMYGGEGNDTYIINKNEGRDAIIDPQKNSKIIFGTGINNSDIILRLGSLELDLGNGNEVHIEGFDQNDVFNSSSVNTFDFADGTELSIEQLLARGFDLEGTGQDDTITGTNTTDRINGLSGNDTLIGGAGNDILNGGAGADQLQGGAGDDLYLNVTGEDTITDVEGHSIIRLAQANGVGVGGLKATYYGDQNQYLRLDIALDNGETLKLQDAFFGTDASLQFVNGNQLDVETLVGSSMTTALNLQGNRGQSPIMQFRLHIDGEKRCPVEPS